MFENNDTKKKMSLLDVMAIRFQCDYLSDLKYLNNFERLQLAEEIQRVSARDEDLWNWNDALEYLVGSKMACSNAEQAKAALIAALREPRGRR